MASLDVRRLTVTVPRGTGISAIHDLKGIAMKHPGRCELAIRTERGTTLTLGPEWRCNPSMDAIALLCKLGRVEALNGSS